MAEYTVRLKDLYKSDVVPALQKKFQYKSSMQIPKLDKVVLNVGCGDARENSKAIDSVIADLTLITGQKAVPTYARKSVANFKVREGMKIGAKVTLRGDRMYEFVDKLFNFALPRVRDFKGINPNAFDGKLLPRSEGAAHIPRDRVRQGRQDPRNGHLLRNHRSERRRGSRAA